MTKRNFILLIIVAVIIVAGILGFLFLRNSANNPTTNPGGTNFGSGLSPFPSNGTGSGTTTPPAGSTSNQPGNTATGTATTSKLQRVSSMPIAGFAVFPLERLKDIVATDTTNPTPTLPLSGAGVTVPPAKGGSGGLVKKTVTPAPLTEMSTALRYVDRATGNIYETFADNLQERQFSNTVIPQVYEADFGNNANSVVMRYLKTGTDTIETFIGNTPKELLGSSPTTANQVTGSFLAENIKDLSVSPDGSSIFYLLNVSDNAIGTTMNLTTNKKVEVFSSPFTEWLSQWPSNDSKSKIVTLSTKPSTGIPGYMYTLNPSSGSKTFSQAFGGVNGLTTLTSPNGKLVLYADDTLALNIYNINTKVSSSAGVNTLPDKCVWGSASDVIYCAVPKSIPIGSYPDDWYQGSVSFADQIWKIDVATGNATMLLDPATETGGGEIDGTKLALDGGENYLFFVNKKDSFLWEYNLK